MLATTLAVIAATAVCLAFTTTRWMGVFGIALLSYLHPMVVIASSIVAVLAVAIFHLYRRRSYRALPSPDSRSD